MWKFFLPGSPGPDNGDSAPGDGHITTPEQAQSLKDRIARYLHAKSEAGARRDAAISPQCRDLLRQFDVIIATKLEIRGQERFLGRRLSESEADRAARIAENEVNRYYGRA